MSCGRLSRASDAWRARFDAAHKEANAIFVQPLSLSINGWSEEPRLVSAFHTAWPEIAHISLPSFCKTEPVIPGNNTTMSRIRTFTTGSPWANSFHGTRRRPRTLVHQESVRRLV